MGPPGRDPRGELVRPFAITRGRTAPRRAIAIEAVLMPAAEGQRRPSNMGPHKQMIESLIREQPLSLAELAAYTRLPLGVCRVLVADMLNDGLLTLQEAFEDASELDHIELLERVLVGLRRL